MNRFFLGLSAFALLTIPQKSDAQDSQKQQFIPSMQQYDAGKAAKNPLWAKLITNFAQFVEQEKNQQIITIPKIIHQIWLGSEFPERSKKLRDTWLAQHPDWEYMLWTEQEIDALGLENNNLYIAATNYGEKSDIARYEILYRIGGLYIDTDFECLQKFNDLHHYCTFYAGLNGGPDLIAFNGLIGSIPGHPILEGCIKGLQESHAHANNSNEPSAIICRSGPVFFTHCIDTYMKTNDDNTVVLFPTNYFYPWPASHRFITERTKIEKWFKPESLAVHHWHCSWQKK